jgi:Fe-S cluster assembly protein SufD
MTQIQTAPTFVEKVKEAFHIFEQNTQNQSFAKINNVRKEALALFSEMGFPTTKHEEWKYTNLKKLIASDFSFQTTVQEIDVQKFLPQNFEGYLLVFLNGKFLPSLSSDLQSNIFVGNLADGFSKYESVIQQYLGKISDTQSSVFHALNMAFAWDGAFVYVPKGKTLEKPIWVLHITDNQNSNVLSQLRNLLLVEENAEATVIEQTLVIGQEKSFLNKVSEVFVGKNARLKHYLLQEEGENGFQVSNTQMRQLDGSVYDNFTFSLSGNMIRNNLNLLLDGERCEGNMYGLYMIGGNSHVDNHTSVDHLKPHSQSNEMYKGVLDGKSTGVFNGKIYVRPHAQKTNAFQSNRNILLSDQATMDTKPQLEIWADDVKCSHGATVGSLDIEPLFYLKSRGIPEKKAKALLTFAFAMDLIEKIKLDSLQKLIESKIMAQLGYEK